MEEIQPFKIEWISQHSIVVAVSLVGFVAFTLLTAKSLMNQYHWNANLEGRALSLFLEMLGISN